MDVDSDCGSSHKRSISLGMPPKGLIFGCTAESARVPSDQLKYGCCSSTNIGWISGSGRAWRAEISARKSKDEGGIGFDDDVISRGTGRFAMLCASVPMGGRSCVALSVTGPATVGVTPEIIDARRFCGEPFALDWVWPLACRLRTSLHVN